MAETIIFHSLQELEEHNESLGDVNAWIEDTVPPALLREERNRLLVDTDWWANSDLTMTAKQTAYRKSLRDLPATASPELDENGHLTNVTWPTKPE